MNRVNLGSSAYTRAFGKGPEIRMENRFFEENPAVAEGASLLSRPGTDIVSVVGNPPYHALFTQPGVFGGDLFVLSEGLETQLHRYSEALVATQIDGADDIEGLVSFAATAGLYYTHLFIASGGPLKYYEGETYATGSIRVASGGDGFVDQKVRVGDQYYQWTTGDVDGAAADGSETNPWRVRAVSGNRVESFTSLLLALNGEGNRGVDYSTPLADRNPDVRGAEVIVLPTFVPGSHAILLEARERGTDGNLTPVAVISSGTGSALTASAATLTGGGVHALHEVEIPEDSSFFKVVPTSGFVLAFERDSRRFFFIRPGETSIDALDFESAESEPDAIVDAVAVGDQVYIFGENSTEVWFVAGDPERPIQRHGGRAFSIGARHGTAVPLRDSVIFVGRDDTVYIVSGSPQRISNHGIEERIRVNGDGELRAWSFDFDGHTFYVLSLEHQGTFVFDVTTRQWHHWYTQSEKPHWNMVEGVTWGSSVIAASWDRGVVVGLVPGSEHDNGSELIQRVVTGVLPHRQRAFVRNGMTQLEANVGQPAEMGAVILLRFSDDNGKTWIGPYEVGMDVGDFDQLIVFRSLGRIGTPGRIFELTDAGGTIRIDGLYVEVG